MPDSPAKKAWKTGHTTRVVMDLNHNTDADLLQKLSEVPSKQGYIKALIRADIASAAPATKGMTKLQKQAFERFQAMSEN